MSCNVFGEILKTLRKRNKLSQSELGRRVGITKAAISKYETGANQPNLENLLCFAQYFGVTTDYMLGVKNVKTIDVSRLTESQIELLNLFVAEFIVANEKSHQ